VRDLASTLFAVTISPASFNNRAGLSRTMNEHLSDGTELLVVEMGMYGRGEIRDLCRWVRPDIGVITALGPMHLERVGSLEAIAEAKAEILESTSSAVLWVEEPHLRRLADSLTMQRVWRCGWHGTPGLDVSVEETSEGVVVRVDDEIIGSTRRGGGVHPSNVACAVGALLALGVQPARIGSRLSELQPPPHRASPMTTEAGVTVLDDTFNSNPVGATAALRTLRELANGRRFVVTPGMMELGPMQREANAVFASEVIASGAELVIVGRTNRAALLAGARSAGGEAVSVASRAQALEQLTGNLRAGDAVLWENDLPDHYP
ncbi:MAG: Mur ligase family protein, partial [Acidimicrobiia bacterium]